MSKHISNNILHDLYYGKISPWENHSDLSADIRLKLQEINEIFALVSDKLESNDDKAVLASLNGKYDRLFRLVEEDKFCDGFCLGVKFAV